MAVISRNDLLAQRLEPRRETLDFPELGEGVQMVVKGYTIRDRRAIHDACVQYDSTGRMAYDSVQDALLSVLAAIAEPQLSLEDTALIGSWPAEVGDRILLTANRLSGSTNTAHAELKDALRTNPLMRRIYTICREHYKRLPSEMGDVTELEFMEALASAELDSEDVTT